MSVREYAMTQWPDGRACSRPPAVLETAERMQRWIHGTPETCHGCHSQPAVGIRAGQPICGRCKAQQAIRSGEPLADPVGRLARAEADDEPTHVQLRGHAIVFNSRSEWLGFFEYIRPGAVDRTFAEGLDVRGLWSHNPDLPIGRLSAGTLRLRKVTRALATEIDPPRWAAGHVESVTRRDVTGMSFAFETMDDEWRIEDGVPARDVTDMRVFEVSGVAFPAYPATTLRTVAANARADWFREQDTAERLRLAR